MSRAALSGGLLVAALLAVFVALDSRGLPFPATWIPTESVDAGEMLLHRVETGDLVSYTMPLASVSAAAFFSHPSPDAQKHNWSITRAAVYGLTFALGMLLAGWVGAAGGLLLLALPPLAADQLHMTYAALLLLVAGMLVRRARARSAADDVMLGLAIGVSLLYRSPLIFFPLGLIVFDLFASPRGERPGWKRLLPPLLIPAALLLPWIHMNWLLKGAFIPLEHGRTGRGVATAVLGFVQKTDLDLGILLGAAADPTRDGGLMAWALRRILSHPLDYLDSCIRRAIYIISFNPWLFAAALAAVWLNRRRPEWRAVAFLVAYFTAIHCAVTVAPAYLVPIWPLLAVLAGTLPLAVAERFFPKANALPREAASQVLAGGLALATVFTAFTLWTVAAYGRSAAARRSPGAWKAALVEAGGSCAWLLSEEGRRRLAQGDLRGARDNFSRALALKPGDKTAEFHLDWTLALQGFPGRLMQLRLDPDFESASRFKLDMLLAHVALKARDEARAGSILTNALERRTAPSNIVKWPAKPRPSEERTRTHPSVFLMEALQDVLSPMSPADRDGLLLAITRHADRRLIADIWLALAWSAAGRGNRARALSAIDAVKGFELRPEEITTAMRTYARLKLPRAAAAFIAGLTAGAPAAWLDYAEAAMKEGDRPAALEAFVKAAAARADPRRLRLFALNCGGEGACPPALPILAELAARHPGDPNAWLDVATAAQERGDHVTAMAALQTATKLDPRSVRLRDLTGPTAVIEQGGQMTAAAAYAQAARLSPSAVTALAKPQDAAAEEAARARLSALELRAKGDIAGAVKLLQAVVSLRPGDAGAKLDLAETAMDAGQPGLARGALAAAAKQSLEPEFTRRAAQLLSRSGDDSGALALLGEASARLPKDLDLRIERAHIEKRTDRPKALSTLAAAESLVRTAAQRRALALGYQYLGEFPRACPRLAALARESPNEAGLRVDTGVCAYLQGKIRAAELNFAEALRLDPTLASAALSLGAVYTQQRRPADALRVYDAALARVSPNDPVKKLLIQARLKAPKGAEHADR